MKTPRPRPKRPARPSPWLCIPFVWLFIISSRSLSSWLASGARNGTSIDPDLSGSPLDRAVLTLLLVLGGFVLAMRWNRTQRILANNKWLLVLFAYMALSVIWSNFPSISLRRCVRSMGTLAMVLVIFTDPTPLGALKVLLRYLYLAHISLSILTIKYFRNIGVAYTWDGIEEMWVGLAVHKNNLGQVAMCSGLFSAWQILQNWARRKITLDLLLFVLTMWVLRGSKNSHSSTAIIGFIAGFGVLVGLQFVKERVAQLKRVILAGVVICTLTAPLLYFVFEALDTSPEQIMLNATGRDATFSGRTGLWIDLLNNAAKTPILGVGIGAFWVGHTGYALYPLPNWSKVTPEWRPGEGHNGYLDVYVELGLAGLVLVLLTVGSAVSGALRDLRTDFERGVIRLTLLTAIILNNFTESSFLKGTHSLWFLFLLVAINMPPLARDGKGRMLPGQSLLSRRMAT